MCCSPMSPLYSYACPSGHRSNLFLNVNKRTDSTRCYCGKRAKRIIEFFSVHFKGEGFTKYNPPPKAKPKPDIVVDCDKYLKYHGVEDE